MQAGGRRFDPDQLHQFAEGQRAEVSEAAFSSDLWIGAEKVRLFFNNMEEVKRLARKGGFRARARDTNDGRDWVRLYRACLLLVGVSGRCANTCNARRVSA